VRSNASFNARGPGRIKLPAAFAKRAHELLTAAAPAALAGAAAAVAERWIAGLAPLEPVLVRRPPEKPARRKSAPRRPRNPRRR
jgi:hypothetical protein